MSDFTAKMHQKTFGGRALSGPGGELKRSPHPLAVKRGLFLREGGEGGEERGGKGMEGKGGSGRGEGGQW